MSLSALERWYESQCDGRWERSYGIRIETLDNPGWQVHIPLRGTRKQGSALDRIKIDRSEENWIHYWVEKEEFLIACGPQNLSESLQLFIDWFNAN